MTDDENARPRAAQEGTGMVVAEGAMMDSVTEKAARPKGRDLVEGDVLQDGDLFLWRDGWGPVLKRDIGKRIEETSLVGRYARPYESVDPGIGWRIIDRKKEPIEYGDEYWYGLTDTWRDCGDLEEVDEHEIVRRRVKPAVEVARAGDAVIAADGVVVGVAMPTSTPSRVTVKTPDPAKRPRGDVLDEGAEVRAGDLVHVGDDVRPKTRRKWRILDKGETLREDDEFWSDGWHRVGQGAGCVVEAPGRHRRSVEAQPSPGTATQPAPTQAPEDATPIVDLVIADLRARAEAGLRTYGTPLTAHNGRRADIDALQEALDGAMYLRQLVAEIDDVRRVLGASEGETLLAAAERAVARQNRYSDELGEVMDALGRHDDESTVDAAKRRRNERDDALDERDEARCRLTSTEADLAAARARVTHLEQHLAGAQRDAREQRALAEALQDDLAAEMEINTTLRGRMAVDEGVIAALRAQHEETLRRLASAERELERHRHGVTIEGDFVCPDSLALIETKRQLDAVSDVAGFRERECAALRAKLAEAEERARKWEEDEASTAATLARVMGEKTRAEERARAAESALVAERATHAQTRARALEVIDAMAATTPPDLAGLAAREAQAPSGEPAPAEASEPEAIAVLRGWCPTGSPWRGMDRHELVAAAEVLRLYDAARAEIAALTAQVKAKHREAVDVAKAWQAKYFALANEHDRERWAHHATVVAGLGLADELRAASASIARLCAGLDEMRVVERARDAGVESTEPTTYLPSAAPESVAIETPDVVEAHHGRYRIRRIDSAA